MTTEDSTTSYKFYVRDGSMRKISVGNNTIWGTSVSDQVFIREGISLTVPKGTLWKKIPGDLHAIVVNATTNSVWGVTRTGRVFHRFGSSIDNPEGEYWESIPGELKQISYGDSGLWGCDSKHQVYYRCGTRKGEGDAGIYWENISGVAFLHVSSGENIVLAVSTENLLYVRIGITDEKPIGTKWLRVTPVEFEVDYVDITHYTGDVWGLKKNGNIFHIRKSKFEMIQHLLQRESESTIHEQCNQS